MASRSTAILAWCCAVALLAAGLASQPAVNASHAGFVVTSELDEPDASPGDGACISSPSGVCTLRAAIMEANAHAGFDTVSIPPGLYNHWC